MVTNFSEYQVNEIVHEGIKTVIYRGFKKTDKSLALVKVLKEEHSNAEEINYLFNEYQITQKLEIAGIIKGLELAKYNDNYVLILEHFHGLPLKETIFTKKLTIIDFLTIAIQLTTTLNQLHQESIFHQDIKPANIFINPENLEAKITNFGLASRLVKANGKNNNPNLLKSSLAYISPEQTGKINRYIDYRTDFYSLGITFYEMLANQLPFNSTNPMELVRYHIAQIPPPLRELNPEVPEAISLIVMKLLTKTAEKRYQSARAIQADLEFVLQQIKSNQLILNFVPGKLDRTDKFLISQKLYGRETEVASLKTAFERASNGNKETIVISGELGVGKSYLVAEIQKFIVEQPGYFMTGKFEQYNRDRPYSALIQAFSEFLQKIFTESSKDISGWQNKFNRTFGQNSQLIIDIIPEISTIIDSPPPLSSPEMPTGFYQVFKKFISALTQEKVPLILVLDNLQWADSDSLNLISLLRADPEIQYLLFIGTSSRGELAAIKSQIFGGGNISNCLIILPPLKISDIYELLIDTIQSAEPEKLQVLAEFIFNQTQGNPFFVKQLLGNLYAEQLLFFDVNLNCWVWQIAEITSSAIINYSLAKLTMAQIKKQLSSQAIALLKIAICIGDRFELNPIGFIAQDTPKNIGKYLQEIVQFGLIVPIPDSQIISWESDRYLFNPIQYEFLDSSWRQIVYALISEPERNTIHFQIGKYLLQTSSQEQINQNIFAILSHLNSGQISIIPLAEKVEIAKLNLFAGQKAKAISAYATAIKYFHIGLELLPASKWQSHYELTKEIYIELLETESLNNNLERVEYLAELILNKASNLLDRIKVYQIKIGLLYAQNQINQALAIALEVNQMLGVNIYHNFITANLFIESSTINFKLKAKQMAALLSLPQMSDRYKLAAMEICQIFITDPERINSDVFKLMILKMVDLSLKYGNSPLSAHAYCCYGAILCQELKDINLGYQLGAIAVNLSEKISDIKLKIAVGLCFNLLIRHWQEPIKNSFQSWLDILQMSLDIVDIENTSYAAIGYCDRLFWSGGNLKFVADAQLHYIKLLQQYQSEPPIRINSIEIWHQVVYNLMVVAVDRYGLEKLDLMLLKKHNIYTINNIYLAKAMICYFFNNYSAALENLSLISNSDPSWQGNILFVEYKFYFNLTLLALYSPPNRRLLKTINLQQQQMKNWADHAPENYQHKYELLEAEKAKAIGEEAKAMELYDRAIRGARRNGYLQEEALANERAAEFYLTLKCYTIAQIYMTEAYSSYLRWGAKAKAKDLASKYPRLIAYQKPKRVNRLNITNPALTVTHRSNQLFDFNEISKAVLALSGEMVLSNLLDKLMKTLIENVGAQKGFFLVKFKNRWMIAAAGNSDRAGLREEIQVTQSADVLLFTNNANDIELPEEMINSDRLLETDLPHALLNYVERTSENLVLDDAQNAGIFAFDPYITTHEPKSILCLPVIQRDKLIGILYLENNLVTGAFSSKRLPILNLLISQVAISLENAQSYTSLQQELKQLQMESQALEIQCQQLRSPNLTLPPQPPN